MINSSIISSIPLSLNNSWMAHLGSQVYRTGIETLEALFKDTSSPIQPYSGKRLYRLVDTYRQSKRDGTDYDRARVSYTDGIKAALQSKIDPFEKTRKARSILNTHIMGLSILQAKDKSSLSKHISYTLLPSLIDEFGKKMATTSSLALNELDSIPAFIKDNFDSYVNLYKEISLQQKELDSFVEALDQLGSGISRDLLINELLLSRNRNLSKPAKDKIAEILQSERYIDIKLRKKLQIIELLRSHNHEVLLDQPAILSELHENRNNQLEALCHSGPSMFFTSDELENVSFRGEDKVFDTEEPIDPENRSTEEEEAPSTSDTPCIDEVPTLPIGISNTQLNCWYNSTLQILRNAPIYRDILKHKDKFAKDFPTVFASLNLYQKVFVNQILFPESLSNSKIVNIDFYLPNIRKEAHHNLDKEFKEVGIAQEDSQRFLYTLLNKLSIPVAHHIWLPGEEIPSAEETHLFLEKPAPSQLVDNPNLALIKIDLKTLFAETDYQLYGIIFHSGVDYSRGRDFDNGHYFAAVKIQGFWFLCNDSRIAEISETQVEDLIQKKKALLIASRARVEQTESDVE